MTDPSAVGLCFTCRWARVLSNRRGSTFYRCARAEFDPEFVRYPPLPKLACAGYEEAGAGAIVIATFRSRLEAELAAGLLRDAGVESLVQGNDVGMFGPGMTGPTPQGVRLLVGKAQEADARRLLRDAGLVSS